MNLKTEQDGFNPNDSTILISKSVDRVMTAEENKQHEKNRLAVPVNESVRQSTDSAHSNMDMD